MPHRRSIRSQQERHYKNDQHRRPGARRRTPPSTWLQALLAILATWQLDCPIVDGTGTSSISQWDLVAPNRAGRAAHQYLASTLKSSVLSWIHQPQVQHFWSNFVTAPPNQQATLGPTWQRLGIGALADEIRDAWIQYLVAFWMGYRTSSPDTSINQVRLGKSPLYPMLMETLLKITSPVGDDHDASTKDDYLICNQIMNGASIGLTSVVTESSAWPSSTPKKRKRGESTLIKWPSTDYTKDSSSFPAYTSRDTRLCEYASRQVDEEIRLGRMILVDAPPAGGAVSRCTPIWKDANKTKIRLISDFRRSGINYQILLDRTVVYPAKREIFNLISDASSTDYLVQYDVKSAYRLLSVASEEVPFLTLNNPIGPGFLVDSCLPFGLLTSPSLWVRTNAVIHKLQMRFLAAMCGSSSNDGWAPRDKGFVYVDDSCWRSSDPLFCLTSLLTIALICGINIEYSKIRASNVSSVVLGFDINLNQKSITIPITKREQLCSQLKDLLETPGRLLVRKLEALMGKLSWVSQLARRWKAHLCPLFATTSIANKYNLVTIRPGTALLQSLSFFMEELKHFPSKTIPASTCRRFAVITDASLQGLGGIICEVSLNKQDGGLTLHRQHVWWFNLFYTDSPLDWHRVIRFCTHGDRLSLESRDINTLEMLAATKAIHAVQGILADDDDSQLVGRVHLHIFLDNLSMVHVLNSWKSSSQPIQQLLLSVEVWESCISAMHISSQSNFISDFVSRSSRVTIRETFPSAWKELQW